MSIEMNLGKNDLVREVSNFYGEKTEQMGKKMQKNFFPKSDIERKHRIHDLALLRLGYLATMNACIKKSPFSKHEIAIIEKCKQREGWAIWSLGVGTVVSAITVIGYSYLSLRNSSNDSLGTQVFYATLTGIFNGILITGGSYWATGIAPHLASNAFNDQQDMLAEMEEIYADLGAKLIELYFTKASLAVRLAQEVDLVLIKHKITTAISNSGRAELIVARLEEAVNYIKSGKKALPQNIQFKWFIIGLERDFQPKESPVLVG